MLPFLPMVPNWAYSFMALALLLLRTNLLRILGELFIFFWNSARSGMAGMTS